MNHVSGPVTVGLAPCNVVAPMLTDSRQAFDGRLQFGLCSIALLSPASILRPGTLLISFLGLKSLTVMSLEGDAANDGAWKPRAAYAILADEGSLFQVLKTVKE
uniref:Uncharacterized protein n=1 Tax=Rhodosorus marinus TaxID=101924 RepID=A0A7S3ACN6_9RHOD|mmetsp:Transcript_9397/g.40757  ORF Transcript_9397/g.40757 Transcript_9397/m.40757 type:complete len:104 (+) Transcript_9397:647-958(+)